MAAAFDTSHVSPTDAAVTLRSLLRRFNEVLGRPGLQGAADDPLHRRPPDGGLSPVEHAAWTATALSAIHGGLRRVTVELGPVVELPPADVAPPVEGGDLGSEEVVARVGEAAETLADTIAGIHGADWTRRARAGGREITALDIARLAVRIGVEHLRAAETALRSEGFGPGDDGEQSL